MNERSIAAAKLGEKGGKAGRGASKRRSKEHYERLAQMKKEAARLKKEADKKKRKK